MEFLRFIFSDRWIFFGFAALEALTIAGTLDLVKACKRNRKITVVRMGKSVHTTIENATKEEAKNAVLTADYKPDGEEEGQCANRK